MGNNTLILGKRKMRQKPKIMIHEHLDCSLKPRTMLELWERIGFDRAQIAFPNDVVGLWKRAKQSSGFNRRKLRRQAAVNYQKFLVGFASSSLANYVQAIVDHILPLMQTEQNLRRITRERIHDAKVDGIIGMELRFAPQLHTMGGLSLDQVMDAVIEEVDQSPFPLKLIICALRHENGEMARKLADLAIKYREHVGGFDLAADEKAKPGLLRWWLVAAIYVCVLVSEMRGTIHLWETDEPTDEDIRLLILFDLMLEELRSRISGQKLSNEEVWELACVVVDDMFNLEVDTNGDAGSGFLDIGHGFRGNRQGRRVLEICPSSNEVTGQVASYEDHSIDELFRADKLVTVSTDGTLFTEVQLTGEYLKLQSAFGWTEADFLKVNLTALECSSFPDAVKDELRAILESGYDAGCA